MELNAFELNKNTDRTNTQDWIRNTKILSYCVVTEVIGRNLVKVQEIVQDTEIPDAYTVPVLCVRNFAIEIESNLSVGDMVVVLFLNKYNHKMFSDAIKRYDDTDNWSIYDKDATGYNRYSGVAIPFSPARGISDTIISAYRANDKACLDILSYADTSIRFTGYFELSIDPVEKSVIPITFGVNADVVETYNGTKEVKLRKGENISVGIDKDGADIEEASSVNITIGKNVALNIGGNSEAITTNLESLIASISVKELTINVTDKLTINNGSSSVIINSDSIDITGDTINLN